MAILIKENIVNKADESVVVTERKPAILANEIPYQSTFGQDVADAFKQNIFGQIISNDAISFNYRNETFDANFLDPPEELLVGYEEYRDYLSGSYNESHFYAKKRTIDENLKARERLSRSHRIFLPHLVAELGNPINYIPIPLFRGVALLPRVLKGGAVAGGTVAAFEPARRQLDPTSTNAESFMYVGSSFLLGGIFTGALGGGVKKVNTEIAKKVIKEKGGLEELDGNLNQAVSVTEGRTDFSAWSPSDTFEGKIVFVKPKALVGKNKNRVEDVKVEFVENEGTTIFVNEAKIRTDYLKGKHLNTTNGMDPIPENAFSSSDDYIKLLINEKILSKVYKVPFDETEIALVKNVPASQQKQAMRQQKIMYLNRMRKQALQELQERATEDFTSEGNAFTQFFEKFAPLGFVVNLPVSPRVKVSMLKLSGDYGVKARTNGAVPNSAYMNAATNWSPVYRKNHLKRNDFFTMYRTGQEFEPRNVLDIAKQAIFIRATDAVKRGVSKTLGQEPQLDKMNYGEFKDYLYKKVIDDTWEEPNTILKKAIENEREFYSTYKKELEEAGMFQNVKNVQTQLDYAEVDLKSLKDYLPTIKNKVQRTRLNKLIKNIDGEVAGYKKIIKDLEENGKGTANSLNESFEQTASYMLRMYNHEAMMQGKEEFIEIAAAHIRDKPFYKNQTPEYNKKIAEQIYDKIMDIDMIDPEGLAGFGRSKSGAIRGGSKPLMSRSFNIPSKLISKFLITDVEYLAKTYQTRVSRALEMHKMYGDHHLRREMRLIEFDLIKNNLKSNSDNLEIDKVLNAFEDEKDKMLGALSLQDPSSINKRTANFIVNAASLAFMGKVLFSAVVDAARPIMVHGLERTYRDGFMQFSNNLEGFGKASSHLKAMGVATELVMSGARKRVIEEDGIIGGASSWIGRKTDKVVNWFNNAQGPWYMANGLTPWTQMMKEFTGVMSVHRLLEDSLKVVDGTIDEKSLTRLASYGIDKKTARLIAKMPHEDYNGLLTANVLEWGSVSGGDTARRIFKNAIYADVERTIITPSVADRFTLMDGVIRFTDEETARLLDNKFGKALGFQKTERGGKISNAALGLPFQFMSWGVAAQRKLVQSGMTDREQALMSGMIAMVTLGFVSDYMKNPEYFKRKSFEEKLMRAVEISGVLSMTGEFEKLLSTVTNTTLDKNISLRGAFGLDARYQDDLYDLAGLAGAGPSMIIDGAVDFINADNAGDAAKELRGVAPTQGLFYASWLWDLIEAGTAKVISPFYNSDIDKKTN